MAILAEPNALRDGVRDIAPGRPSWSVASRRIVGARELRLEWNGDGHRDHGIATARRTDGQRLADTATPLFDQRRVRFLDRPQAGRRRRRADQAAPYRLWRASP